jgi:hypothetical protein
MDPAQLNARWCVNYATKYCLVLWPVGVLMASSLQLAAWLASNAGRSGLCNKRVVGTGKLALRGGCHTLKDVMVVDLASTYINTHQHTSTYSNIHQHINT